jgi:hypothetical protein
MKTPKEINEANAELWKRENEQRERLAKVDDGAGGLIEQKVKFPVWFQPVSNGGTPMCAALTKVAEELVCWCDRHPNSYPPTVLHVTDGESTDGDPDELATMLKQIGTGDGQVLLLNIHVSANEAAPAKFPSSDSGLPDAYARLLFRMSSQLPEHLINFARGKSYSVTSESRGFVFNADAAEIVEFFDIGTRASQLR